MTAGHPGKVVALAGGVGGARLVDGLVRLLPPEALRIIVNTGDDFEHWGLRICPDLDTIMYTLAELAPEERGWGIDGDTFHVLEEAARRGAPTWFRLGDRDLVTHLTRTAALARGETLTRVTATLCESLGVHFRLLPMGDEPRPTTIVTRRGDELPFQEWLVKERASAEVSTVRHGGSGRPTAEVLDALGGAGLVLICPSNPYVSIDPILTMPGVREALTQTKTVAVSPIVGRTAVKGPLATMISQLSVEEPSARAVAGHYEGLLDGYAVHPGDAFDAPFPILETNILIQARKDRVVFAGELLEFARSLG